MCDGLWLRNFPWQDVRPASFAEPAGEPFAAVDADELLEFAEQSVTLQWADRCRRPGLVDESN